MNDHPGIREELISSIQELIERLLLNAELSEGDKLNAINEAWRAGLLQVEQEEGR